MWEMMVRAMKNSASKMISITQDRKYRISCQNYILQIHLQASAELKL